MTVSNLRESMAEKLYTNIERTQITPDESRETEQALEFAGSEADVVARPFLLSLER